MKSVTRNAFFNMLYQGMNVLFPLLTTAYISRILLAEGVGKVSLASNISSYFILLASLGLPVYGVREIARSSRGKDLSQRFSELLTINIISSLFFSFLYYMLFLTQGYSWVEKPLYFVTGIGILLNMINIDWLYQGIEEYGYITIRSFFVKILSLILIFIFVKDQSDYTPYAIILILITAGNYIPNIFHSRRYVKYSIHKLKTKKHIKPLLIFWVSSLAVGIYTMIDTTMLGIMTDNKVVGYYSNSIRLIKVITQLITALGMVLLPRLSLYYNEKKFIKANNILDKATKAVLTFAFPSTVGIILISRNLVFFLFGKDFVPAISTIRILAPIILIISLSTVLGSNILIATNREKIRLYSTFFVAFSNIILNLFLIPRFEQNGAAVSSVLCELINCIIMLQFSRKTFKLNHIFLFILKIGISTILMCVAFLITAQIDIYSRFTQLVFPTVISILVYVISSHILNNEVIIELTNRLKKLILRKK